MMSRLKAFTPFFGICLVFLSSNVVAEKGWFVGGDLGAFTAVGGYRKSNQGQVVYRSISGIQPFIAFSFGYDVLDWLALGLQASQGYVADAARIANDISSPTDFSLTFVNALLTGSFPIYERLSFSATFLSGLVMMLPPSQAGGGNFGADVGIRIGMDYDTLLQGFVVGLRLSSNLSFLPNTGIGVLPGILSFSITPVISYVF